MLKNQTGSGEPQTRDNLTAENSAATNERKTPPSNLMAENSAVTTDPKSEDSRSNNPHVDWDKWKPFPPEFAIFSGQLKTIHDWFDHYCVALDYCDGGEFYDTVCKICDKTIEIAEHISFLAAEDVLQSLTRNVNASNGAYFVNSGLTAEVSPFLVTLKTVSHLF